MIKSSDFFDLARLNEPLLNLFTGVEKVWEVLNEKYIETYLQSQALFPESITILGHVDQQAVLVNTEHLFIGKGAHVEAGAYITGPVYIGPNTRVEAGAYIAGPTYIGANCQVRQGAYIRGSVVAGDKCVLGHVSEFKNSILLSESHAPHFAYVGDSILGFNVNLGAGTKLSNLSVFSDRYKEAQGERPQIKIHLPDMPDPILTGLRKMGAILGDGVQTGCNVVTNPGCLVGPRTMIYSNVSLGKGYWPANKIIKLRQNLEVATLNP